MVSSFSNPGFPPVHTHPPPFSAMVAVSETSIRETEDNNLQSPRRCFALCNNNKTSIALVLTIWAPLPPSLSALIPRVWECFFWAIVGRAWFYLLSYREGRDA
ncbi:hypothetical protein EV1_032458 [Malus domestica]